MASSTCRLLLLVAESCSASGAAPSAVERSSQLARPASGSSDRSTRSDRQVVRLERGEVARRLGVDERAERLLASPGIGRSSSAWSAVELDEAADRRRRPCAAGRSSAGSAARSRGSSRAASGRAAAAAMPRSARVALRRRRDVRLDAEVAVAAGAREVAAQLVGEPSLARRSGAAGASPKSVSGPSLASGSSVGQRAARRGTARARAWCCPSTR